AALRCSRTLVRSAPVPAPPRARASSLPFKGAAGPESLRCRCAPVLAYPRTLRSGARAALRSALLAPFVRSLMSPQRGRQKIAAAWFVRAVKGAHGLDRHHGRRRRHAAVAAVPAAAPQAVPGAPARRSEPAAGDGRAHAAAVPDRAHRGG